MKNINVKVILLFVVLISCFLVLYSNSNVIGQTQDSTSSSSSGSTSTTSSSSGEVSLSSSSSSSGVIAVNEGFTGIWKAKVSRCMPIQGSSSSSSSGCVICTQVVPECSSGQTVISQTCTECAHCGNVIATNSSSSGQVITSSSSSGGTKLCVDRGSRVITLKLCVRNGKLEGVLHQGNVFDKAVIDSQTVVSKDEVVVNLKDKKGKTATATLKLLGERQLRGTFATSDLTFEARKLNSFRACFAPGHEDKPFFGNDNNDNDHKGPNHNVSNGPPNGVPPFGMNHK